MEFNSDHNLSSGESCDTLPQTTQEATQEDSQEQIQDELNSNQYTVQSIQSPNDDMCIYNEIPQVFVQNESLKECSSNEEALSPQSTNIIMELLKQVSIGMDLSKVMIPVDFLEPQSLLERITVYCRVVELLYEDCLTSIIHPKEIDNVQSLFQQNAVENNSQNAQNIAQNDRIQNVLGDTQESLDHLNVERMLHVIKWYLSAWHIKPAGVKKPVSIS